jgi:hypothetical protein
MKKEIKFYINSYTDGDGNKVELNHLLGMMVVDYGTDDNGDYILFEVQINV